jgi:hypothetical protein
MQTKKMPNRKWTQYIVTSTSLSVFFIKLIPDSFPKDLTSLNNCETSQINIFFLTK